MKKLFLLFMLCMFLLLPLFLFGQTSNLTATITDSDSQTWNNGAFTITFVGIPGVAQYQWNGAPLDLAHQMFTGIMNGSGAMSAAIPDSSTISPSGTQWRFTLCSDTSAPCSNVTTPVTGGSPDLSSTLSAGIKAPRINAGTGSFAYADAEINPVPTVGLTYWNVTTPGLRIWNGSAWQASGGSGSGTVTVGTQCYYAAYLLATASVSPILPFAYPGECLGISAVLSDNASIINAAAVALTAIGPGNRLKLPPGVIKATSAALNLKSTIIVGADSGVPGWNQISPPNPATTILFSHDDTATAHTLCLSSGNCGFQNIKLEDDTTSSPMGPLYTCGNPWLDNVMWQGEISATSGTPTNDALLFGSAAGHNGATCDDTTQGFVGYGEAHIHDLYFRNTRVWVSLYDNANVMNFYDLHGDFTDSGTTTSGTRTSYMIWADGMTSSTYGNEFYGIKAEQSNFGTHACNYAGVFGLNRNAENYKAIYSSSDVGNCTHSADIFDTTSQGNDIESMAGSFTTNPSIVDASPSFANLIIDNGLRLLAYKNIEALNFGVIGANKGFNFANANSGGVYAWQNGGGSARDTGISRIGAAKGGIGNGTQGDISGIWDAADVELSDATPTINGRCGFNTTAGRLVCGDGTLTQTYQTAPVVSTQTILVTGTTAVQGTLITLFPTTLVAGTYMVSNAVEESDVGSGCTTATGTFRIEYGFVDLDSGATFTINTPGYVIALSSGSGSNANQITYATTITRGTQGSGVGIFRVNTGTALTARLVETANTICTTTQPTYKITVTAQKMF